MPEVISKIEYSTKKIQSRIDSLRNKGKRSEAENIELYELEKQLEQIKDPELDEIEKQLKQITDVVKGLESEHIPDSGNEEDYLETTEVIIFKNPNQTHNGKRVVAMILYTIPSQYSRDRMASHASLLPESLKSLFGSQKESEATQEQALETKSSSDHKRWYEDSDFVDLVKENDNSVVFAPTPTAFADLVGQNIQTAKTQASNNNKTSLMPFNVNGNHWVGGAVANLNNEVCFIYNDPLGNPIDKDLAEQFEKEGIKVIDLQQQQQHDNHNCGPFTVDNLENFAAAVTNIQELNKDGKTISEEEIVASLKRDLAKGSQNAQEIRDQHEATRQNAESQTTHGRHVQALLDKRQRQEESRIDQPQGSSR